MEILSETRLMGDFVYGIVLCSVITLVGVILTIAFLTTYLTEKRRISDLLLTIGAAIATALIAWISVDVLSGGPDVEYKAIVTDWNAVYDRGYKVVETEGKIVTLTKE